MHQKPEQDSSPAHSQTNRERSNDTVTNKIFRMNILGLLFAARSQRVAFFRKLCFFRGG